MATNLSNENKRLREQLKQAQAITDPFNDYGPETSVQVRVIGIEFVVPINQDDTDHFIERALEELRCIGAADVVKQCFSNMSFDEASAILSLHSKNCT